MHLLILLFRLPWYVYIIVAPLIFAGAVTTYFGADGEEAAKRAALRGPAPKAIAIEAFEPTRDVGNANEINVVGQLDLERSMEYTETKKGAELHHWTLIPIYAASATDANGPAPGVLVYDGVVSDAQLAKLQTAQGKFGPILTIDGLKSDDTGASLANEKAFAARGPDTTRAVLVTPFLDGRVAGLRPSSEHRNTAYGLATFALMTLGYGGFMWLLGYWRRRREEADAQAYL